MNQRNTKRTGAAWLFLFAGLALLSSCQLQSVTGSVMDKETMRPVDSAYVANAHEHMYTDALGNFKLKNRYIGFRKRREMGVYIMKKGYLSKTVGIDCGAPKVIYMDHVY